MYLYKSTSLFNFPTNQLFSVELPSCACIRKELIFTKYFPNEDKFLLLPHCGWIFYLLTCCRAKSPETPNEPSIRRYSSTFLPGKCFCINSTEQTYKKKKNTRSQKKMKNFFFVKDTWWKKVSNCLFVCTNNTLWYK